MKKMMLLLLAIGACLSFGQLDPTGIKLGASFELYESSNKVGEVYVPARDPNVTHYVEHWVLYPNYVYPGPKSLATLKVVPLSASPYQDETAFFKRVRFSAGSKYIRVTADEFNQLPAVQ